MPRFRCKKRLFQGYQISAGLIRTRYTRDERIPKPEATSDYLHESPMSPMYPHSLLEHRWLLQNNPPSTFLK